MKTLKDALKVINKSKLAQKTGVSRMTIIRITTGEVTPSLTNYLKLCKGLGVKPSQFIDNEDY